MSFNVSLLLLFNLAFAQTSQIQRTPIFAAFSKNPSEMTKVVVKTTLADQKFFFETCLVPPGILQTSDFLSYLKFSSLLCQKLNVFEFEEAGSENILKKILVDFNQSFLMASASSQRSEKVLLYFLGSAMGIMGVVTGYIFFRMGATAPSVGFSPGVGVFFKSLGFLIPIVAMGSFSLLLFGKNPPTHQEEAIKENAVTAVLLIHHRLFDEAVNALDQASTRAAQSLVKP